MLHCAPVFLPAIHLWLQHAVYFPDAFLTQMREAMPSTLSFDEFIFGLPTPVAPQYTHQYA
ncbi:rRNA (cytosine-C(5)-)-methyltransferase RsmF [Salmonella enterica subsp. enterica]|uniref:rRNA (Cytosine-C(5)-)-methyltransferase RsmF n=1 Tax=Salmonella enterica I TaxID=59201 RepID=A0A379WS22_SALET|nr:rRNA (cytosine-C(5)-)-methyltransferase RsmF [Salmonella enterica subsp. enterica]